MSEDNNNMVHPKIKQMIIPVIKQAILCNAAATAHKIKHIVCSGGGVTGFAFYGVVQECHKQNLWKIEDIQSMYGTSVGSILSVILALNYDWETLDDFLIKRPWHNVFKFNMYTLFSSINKKGILDVKCIEETLLPLFSGKDISINITMKEFFEWSKIDIHIFTTELNTFDTIDISHTTHPDWRVVDAIYCSSALPIVFTPLLNVDENTCYCDGGLMLNYPIQKCIDNGGNMDEILGITRASDPSIKPTIHPESNMFDYVMMLINKLIYVATDRHLLKDFSQLISNQYVVYSPAVSVYDIYNAASNMEERVRLIKLGTDLVQIRNTK